MVHEAVRLHTLPGTLHPVYFRCDLSSIPFDLVYGIELPDGQFVENRQHDRRQSFSFRQEADPTVENVHLEPGQSKRLAAAFGMLTVGHETDCHDMLTTVFGWESDRSGLDCILPPVTPNEPLRSGTPYAIIADQPNSEYHRTHSCIGTASGKTVGTLGYNSMFGVLSGETALAMENYNNRGQAWLAVAVEPAAARPFPDGIVPASRAAI